ncbi:MAG: BrnA antitoxin family protein [Nitrospirota bacterium]|nr:BrnA antitoxin family protein [Nitrospirota bacterium]
MGKTSGSSVRGVPAKKNGKGTVKSRKIDYSDIPESNSAQLRAMRRVGRPPMGKTPRQLIALRVDPNVLKAVRKEAKQRSKGYQTLINEILAKHTQKVSA